MQKLLFPCLVLFLALSLVDARPPVMQKDDTWYQKGKSVILKSGNFEEYIRQEPNVIVEFITSFSTDSQKMVGEWNKLADMYMGENPKRSDVKVAIIDGWTFSTVSHEYGVKVFPQIMLFTGGNKDPKAKYEGEKTAERISEWLEAEIASANAGATQTVDDTVATSDASADAPAATSTDSTTQQNQADQKPPVEEPVQTPPPAQQQQQQQQQQQPPQQQQQQQQPPQQQQQQPPQQQQQQQQPPKPQTPPPQQQQQQQPPKPQTPPPQQQKQENNAPTGQEEARKEVKVVLNTTLLQSQFESLQKHMDTVTVNLKDNINDNVKKIDELKSLLDTQKQEMANLHMSLRAQTQKFDELKQFLVNNKQEVQQTVTGHTEKHLEEVKGALHQIKGKVFEQKPVESKGFGSGLLYLVIGGLVGGAITFVVLNMGSNNKKRKLLID